MSVATESITPTTQVERFRALHRAERPLVLVNCWDVGSAIATARGGAAAVATSSWAVAAAAGQEDGERLRLETVLTLARSVAEAVDVPVTIDVERGYAGSADALAEVARAVLTTGAVGVNLEDGTPDGVRSTGEAAQRVAAVVEAVAGGLFVNARTDLFLASDPAEHAGLIDDAVERARAWAAAGAEGFFVPGLVEADLVARVVARSPLPVNVMVSTRGQVRALAAAGARRISLGPAAYLSAMDAVTADAGTWFQAVA